MEEFWFSFNPRREQTSVAWRGLSAGFRHQSLRRQGADVGSVAEWSKAGFRHQSLRRRGFESHRCHAQAALFCSKLEMEEFWFSF
ncbi:hypothetical protein CEXT_521891 [Caerostris extrusa]|uniref:Uncharacterized protein n=1 Tax=Caerostris extrusa TaxID=172846 RepID=A0AAV4NGG8_CAEEX|nr:hypothetical protein CEXT_521891 [Caerostris extrusa]